jgi:uncharacterized protein (DUF952 family)
MIYRIATMADWLKAMSAGFFQSADLAAEGFIHLAEREQVQGVYNRYYCEQRELVLLAVDESLLAVPLRRENTSGGTELFPHAYGPLPLAAVRGHALLAVDADGRVLWPDGW